MKIGTRDEFRITAAALRDAASVLRLHSRCSIRKCRRDDGCTGPLLRHDEAAARFLAARPGDAAGEIAPLCCFALDEAGRARVAAVAGHILARLDEVPRAALREETRALAARDWSAFCCPVPSAAAQSAVPAEKPL